MNLWKEKLSIQMRISVATYADVIKTRFQNNILYILQSRFAKEVVFLFYLLLFRENQIMKKRTLTHTHMDKNSIFLHTVAEKQSVEGN